MKFMFKDLQTLRWATEDFNEETGSMELSTVQRVKNKKIIKKKNVGKKWGVDQNMKKFFFFIIIIIII